MAGDAQARGPRERPERRRALVSHTTTYTLAFAPALAWLAGDLGAAGTAAIAAGVFLPHLVQDDGRLLSAYVRTVKRTEPAPGMLMLAVDQSFHLLVLFGLAARRRSMTRALRVRMLLAVAVLAAGLACVIERGGSLERLELSTVDARFELRGEQPRAARQRSSSGSTTRRSTSSSERWPFSRNRFAKVLETVSAADPSVIVYDVQFTEESDDPRADNRLIEASRAAGNVVFSTTETGERGESNVFGGGEALAYARAESGNGLLPEDPGGVVRRVPAQIDGLDTLAVAAVRRLGEPIPFDGLGGEGGWIDFRGRRRAPPPGVVLRRSPGRVPAERVRGKIVVVGATRPSLQDVAPGVLGRRGTMSGRRCTRPRSDTLLRGAPCAPTRKGLEPR